MCLAVNTDALPKTRTHSDVFTQRAVVLFRWNEKCTVSDLACNSTFICYHVTDNPPIKCQGCAWVLCKKAYCLTTLNFCVSEKEKIKKILSEKKRKTVAHQFLLDNYCTCMYTKLMSMPSPINQRKIYNFHL